MFKSKQLTKSIVCALMLFFTLKNGWTQDKHSITMEQAHALAKATLTSRARHLPGMRFDQEKGSHPPGFYWFEVTADVPGDASPLLGYFAVNWSNGEVWNFVSCKKLESPAVLSLQRKFRREAKLSEDEVKRASKEIPCEP